MCRNAIKILLIGTVLTTGCGSDNKDDLKDAESQKRKEMLQALTDSTLLFDVKSEASACDYAKKRAVERSLVVADCSLSTDQYSVRLENYPVQTFNMKSSKTELKSSIQMSEDVAVLQYFELLVSALDYSKSRSLGM